jgi:hypothetical protein
VPVAEGMMKLTRVARRLAVLIRGFDAALAVECAVLSRLLWSV